MLLCTSVIMTLHSNMRIQISSAGSDTVRPGMFWCNSKAVVWYCMQGYWFEFRPCHELFSLTFVEVSFNHFRKITGGMDVCLL